MSEKAEDIIHAARAMFSRYGYSKTTMGDIAHQAGVARQTVYNAFPGKDEILRAVVRLTGEETRRAVHADWDTSDSLDEMLGSFCKHGPVAWYEVMRTAPDWAELMDGVHKAASAEIETLNNQWRSDLKAALVNKDVKSNQDGLTLDDVIDFFYSASANAKHGAETVDVLKKRLLAIRAATLALLKTT